nr:site-specific integrase [Streptomyces antimycoticus]
MREADLQAGMLALLAADMVRPEMTWLTPRMNKHFREAIVQARDADGFERLEASVSPDLWSSKNGRGARVLICVIVAAKGGLLRDITVGDFLELRRLTNLGKYHHLTLAYAWLRNMGTFPDDAPTTLRAVESHTGQVSVAQLVDRYQLQCTPVRNLIVEYLTERQPTIDYTTLEGLSRVLASQFWANLERHHPGIQSLNLAPEVTSAWKARIATKTRRERQPDGTVREVTSPRTSAPAILMQVRAFYLDLAQWAADEPERWAHWVARCPITTREVSTKKLESQQKARMDQRTRERLPTLPILVKVADQRLKEARVLFDRQRETPALAKFTANGRTYTKARSSVWSDPDRSTWAYDEHGSRIDVALMENRAFWAWASIEVLRHTGIRVEEMLEISHHSIIQYKLPTTGEIVPLLQIAPSKTDEERLLLVNPELADVLSAIVSRVRDSSGRIPLVASYDLGEKVWNSPMPLLFQWWVNGENRALSVNTIRRCLAETLESAELTDNTGQPLKYQPHDFRRIFITDAILSGLPPHIAQIIAGHHSINTTMRYNAVYPMAAIEAHRAFIARRRTLRPSEEYRVPTDEEWDSFLGHFERRKLSLGVCGRAYGSDCIHEHACVRCTMLRVDPTERPRLEEIRDNLIARIAEAEREGWLGEVDGLNVSLAAAEEKLAQLDAQESRRSSTVHLGMPTFSQIATATVDTAKPNPEPST